jgi:hypothetical protein
MNGPSVPRTDLLVSLSSLVETLENDKELSETSMLSLGLNKLTREVTVKITLLATLGTHHASQIQLSESDAAN